MENNQSNQRKQIILGWIRIVIGLLIFSFGVHLTIYANIGLAPWDCLGMGIAKRTPLNYGVSITLVAVTVLFIDIIMKEKIGFGTVIDALLVGLGKRMKKLPIGIVEILLWGIVLLCGWLLGGPVGIGTLISTFGAGLVMQLVYMLIHFEPRNLHHQNFLKTVEILSGRK